MVIGLGKKRERKAKNGNPRKVAVNPEDLERTLEALKVLRTLDREGVNQLADKFGAAAVRYSPKGRTQRKRAERPRPDLPSDAPANRNRKQVALTLPPDLLDQVSSKCQELGVQRTAFIEYALRQILKPD